VKKSINIYILIRHTTLIVLPFRLTMSYNVIQHDTIRCLKSYYVKRDLEYLKEVNVSINYLTLINWLNDLLCEHENSEQKYVYPAVVVRVVLVVLSLVLLVDMKYHTNEQAEQYIILKAKS